MAAAEKKNAGLAGETGETLLTEMLGSLVESVAAPVAAASLARKPNWQRAVSSLDRLGQPVAFVDARSPPYQQSEAASHVLQKVEIQ